MAELQRRFALGAGWPAAADTGNAGIGLRALNGVGKVKLQLRPNSRVDAAALGRALGTDPFPASPRIPVRGTPAVFWTAPAEWLIAGAGVDAGHCSKKLAGVLAGQTCAVTELSDGLTVIELEGDRSPDLLRSCCSIDLDGPDAELGHYFMTRMHELPVLIHRLEETAFQVYVDRSVAQFLCDWMGQVVGKFGDSLLNCVESRFGSSMDQAIK